MKHGLALSFVFVTLGTTAWAQTSAVPPPTQSSSDAARDGKILDGALATPGAIVTGAGLAEVAGRRFQDAKKTFSAADNVGYIMTGTEAVIKGAQGYQQDGLKGAMREGGQVVLQAGKDYVKDEAAVLGIRLATGVTSSAAVGLYTSGAIGWSIGDAIDQRYGNDILNSYWPLVPDSVKEWTSGVKQFDEKAFQARPDPISSTRRNMFSRIQAENADQERQRQAAADAAQASMSSSNSAQGDGGAAFATFTNGLMQQYLQNRANRPIVSNSNSSSSSASANSCKLDPQTGCHIGHDEKSHAGGCKVCR